MRRGSTVPAERLAAPHFVYTVWSGDRALYVGCTNNVDRRIKEHKRYRAWATVDFRVEVDQYPDLLTALDAESALISRLRPAQNVRGAAS